MRYLGIDYGTKKIGLAKSDDDGRLAFPHKIIPAGNSLSAILEVIEKEKIDIVVMGESMNLKNEPNIIHEEIKAFAGLLERESKKPVHLIKEFFTSSEARWGTKRKKPVANPHRSGKPHKKKEVDDSAAALILQRYLDTVQLSE